MIMENPSLLIISNNGSLENQLSGISVRYIGAPLDEIYTSISNALQNHYELLTSPLPPNVPMIRSPVRSVILGRTERKYDSHGLLLLEKAKERTNALGINDAPHLRKDQEFLDRDHLLRAIMHLKEIAAN